MVSGMADYDMYGNRLPLPGAAAIPEYAQAVLAHAGPLKLAELAEKVRDYCFAEAARDRDDARAARTALLGTVRFLGLEDHKRVSAAREEGFHLGRVEGWEGMAWTYDALAVAHRRSAN